MIIPRSRLLELAKSLNGREGVCEESRKRIVFYGTRECLWLRPHILHKELIIIRFDSVVICIYASPNRFFLLDLARVQSLPSAAPTREEPRDAVSSGHGMCKTFSLSRQAENLSPRGRKEEEHERASHF